MAERSLAELAQRMKAIDVAMFITKTDDGKIAARPMSNNGDVSEKDGTTYHFATDDGRIDNDLEANSACGATYSSGDFYAAVQGRATLISDRTVQERHWVPNLKTWFENGLDTDGLILVEVTPERIAWWDGREEGQVVI